MRPYTTIVLAMSVDGKIADRSRSAARFGSQWDQAHLERQVAAADAVLFGAGTLRAYGTTMIVRLPELVQRRRAEGKPEQPIQIVCSASGRLDRQYRFFSQPVPRWLLTREPGDWGEPEFDRVMTFAGAMTSGRSETIDWRQVLAQLAELGIERLAVLGGGELVGGIVAAGLVDELRLTVCPLILGGAMSPVGGVGFLEAVAPRLKLVDCQPIGDEIFLHYRVIP